jgi:hypothetical protein
MATETLDVLQAQANQQAQATLPPLLGEQGLLIAAGMLLALSLVAGLCVTILYRANPAIADQVTRTQPLHILTVLAVVCATTVLALERILTGEVAASLLSGIVGYVLGSLKQTPDLRTGGGQ